MARVERGSPRSREDSRAWATSSRGGVVASVGAPSRSTTLSRRVRGQTWAEAFRRALAVGDYTSCSARAGTRVSTSSSTADGLHLPPPPPRACDLTSSASSEQPLEKLLAYLERWLNFLGVLQRDDFNFDYGLRRLGVDDDPRAAAGRGQRAPATEMLHDHRRSARTCRRYKPHAIASGLIATSISPGTWRQHFLARGRQRLPLLLELRPRHGVLMHYRPRPLPKCRTRAITMSAVPATEIQG